MKRAIRPSKLRRRSMMMLLSSAGNNPDMSTDSVAVRRALTLTLFFAAIVFPCLVLYNAAYPFQIFDRNSSVSYDPSSALNRIFSFDDSPTVDSEELRLERTLKDAAMDRTVILTTLNEAWATPGSILDLFLESFRIGDHTSGLLKHLVIIALDEKAYTRCLAVHTHCFALKTEGVDFSGEAYFMTPDYLKMMWRRIDFLRSVLEMGYNFVFTDADIMWFRNPFPRFYLDADFQIACDHFTGDSYDVQNKPNGGFNYVKSSNQTIEFYKFWYSARETHPGYHDQDVLNIIKFDPYIFELGLTMRFLDTAYFGGLCEHSRDFNKVCTMHANCCYGLDSKLHDLRIMLEDWKIFLSLPESLKKSQPLSWRVPSNCSLMLRHPSNNMSPEPSNWQ